MKNGTGSAACRGDSGGQLAQVGTNGQLFIVGVVSFGAPQCQVDLPNIPDIFTEVRIYSDWIQSKTASYNDYYGDSVLETLKKVSGKL